MIIKLDRTAFKRNLWHRALEKALNRLDDDRTTKTKIKQIVFYGVKCYGRWNDSKGIELKSKMGEIFQIIELIEALTPREFMQIFPLAKDYDGQRWETKDYFYTMDYLEMLGMDEPIGENVFEFLMEYWNTDVMLFTLKATSGLSAVYEEQTGIGIFEEFLRNQGIEPFDYY
ncbi:hypothetical protein [Enterococcus faecium]|uniref:hypothetical protein n=1 Tax=Enterococcus faecium TaxID=1352 RepID=UPI000BF24444|nr:hypothetical protein [Enterococcus faecium]PEH48931.1 hypothetical protein CRM75_14060 [Enterococcus faecium]